MTPRPRDPTKPKTTRRTPKPRSPTAIRMAGYELRLVLPQDLATHYHDRCENEHRDDIMEMILHDLEGYHEYRRGLDREAERLR